jgi:hypothetical protein
MTGGVQLVEGPVEPQPAALMRAHPRDRLGLAVDPTHEPDHRTDVKGMHHAGGLICACRDDLPAAVTGLHRRPVGARAAVRGDALCSGSGDNAGTPCQRGGRRGDNHLPTCCVRSVRRSAFRGRPVSAASRRWRSVRKSSLGASLAVRAARNSIAVRICAASKRSASNGRGRRPQSRSSI